jgi:hypothetical protein
MPIFSCIRDVGGMLAKLDQPLCGIGVLRRIGISDFGAATNGGLSRKPELFSQPARQGFCKAYWCVVPALKTSLRNHVAAGVAAFERVASSPARR